MTLFVLLLKFCVRVYAVLNDRMEIIMNNKLKFTRIKRVVACLLIVLLVVPHSIYATNIDTNNDVNNAITEGENISLQDSPLQDADFAYNAVASDVSDVTSDDAIASNNGVAEANENVDGQSGEDEDSAIINGNNDGNNEAQDGNTGKDIEKDDADTSDASVNSQDDAKSDVKDSVKSDITRDAKDDVNRTTDVLKE
jgi:hypothetical protein